MPPSSSSSSSVRTAARTAWTWRAPTTRSHRGRSGGYSLGRPAKDISFADVLRVTDGPLALTPCVSVMAYRKCDDCFDEAVCGIRKVMAVARDVTAEVLESRSLGAVAAQMRRAGAL